MNLLDIIKSIFSTKSKSEELLVKDASIHSNPTLSSSEAMKLIDDGCELFKLEKIAEAKQMFRRIFNYSGLSRELIGYAYNNIASCHIFEDNYSEAEQAANQATLYVKNLPIMANLGYIQYNLGNYVDSYSTYKHSTIDDDSSDNVYFYLALCNVKLDNYEQATKFFCKCLEKYRCYGDSEPNVVEFISQQSGKRCHLLFGDGKRSESVHHQNTCADDKIFYSQVLFCLSDAYLSIGKQKQSKECMEIILSFDNTNEMALKAIHGDKYNDHTPLPLCSTEETTCFNEPCTFVDLGLRSGTLWARANVGAADQPQELGTYFTMGNLPDGLPTYEQAQELIEECQFEEVFLVNGPCDKAWSLTGPNGNSIFFPIEKDNDVCNADAATSWCQGGSFAPFMLFMQHTLTIGAAMSPDVQIQARMVKCRVQDNKKNERKYNSQHILLRDFGDYTYSYDKQSKTLHISESEQVAFTSWSDDSDARKYIREVENVVFEGKRVRDAALPRS